MTSFKFTRMGNSDVNLIWRFYRGEDRQWRWQQLSVGRDVVSDSPSAHPDYEHCLADARQQGYVYQASQPGQKARR
jgi:hypothetical protein